MIRFSGRPRVVGCTIEIEHSAEHLHAHLALDGDIPLGPGDQVRVHGAPVKVSFGDKLTLRRTATVRTASALARAWTRLIARFELGELYEVSFTSRRF